MAKVRVMVPTDNGAQQPGQVTDQAAVTNVPNSAPVVESQQPVAPSRQYVQPPVQMQSQHPEQPVRKFPLKKLAAVAAVAVLVFVVGLLISERNKLQEQVSVLSADTQGSDQDQAKKYHEDISKLIEVPAGQTPTLVTVSDAKKAAENSPFFSNAQNGDVALFYVNEDKTYKAVLYRPTTKKIIEVASASSVNQGAAGQSEAAPTIAPPTSR